MTTQKQRDTSAIARKTSQTKRAEEDGTGSKTLEGTRTGHDY